MIDKVTQLRRIGKEIKWGVVFCDVLMTLYVLWLIFTDASTWIVGILFGFTPFGAFELYRASRLFGLCIYHKLMLAHSVLVYGCCVWQAYFGFGEFLPYMRWIMFMLGFILILFIALKSMVKDGHDEDISSKKTEGCCSCNRKQYLRNK